MTWRIVVVETKLFLRVAIKNAEDLLNNQNKQGQCALHYAMEYNYFDMGTWLADGENGAGADDTLENQFQLTPYDGLGV